MHTNNREQRPVNPENRVTLSAWHDRHNGVWHATVSVPQLTPLMPGQAPVWAVVWTDFGSTEAEAKNNAARGWGRACQEWADKAAVWVSLTED